MVGIAQYRRFVNKRVSDKTTDFNNTIRKKTNYSCLAPAPVRQLIDRHLGWSVWKLMCNSSQRCTFQDGWVFMNENHAWPLSFASNCTVIHTTIESDLISCVVSMVPSETNVRNVDVKIIDGAGMVHRLDPRKAHTLVKTVQDYCAYVFLPYIENMLQFVNRLDIVWDVYGNDSLKYQARQKRGTGNTFDRNTSIPPDWKNCLLYSHRPKQRWSLQIASHVYSRVLPPLGKQVISTHGQDVLSSPICDLSGLHCTPEEADTRLLLHAPHCFSRGFSKNIIYATDTDVVIIAIVVSSLFENC